MVLRKKPGSYDSKERTEVWQMVEKKRNIFNDDGTENFKKKGDTYKDDEQGFQEPDSSAMGQFGQYVIPAGMNKEGTECE